MKTNLSQESAATLSKKDRFDKKNVNVKVNPFINFQIGLVAALMLALVIIEISNTKIEIIEPVRAMVQHHPTDDWEHKTFIAVPDHPVQKVVTTPSIKNVPPRIVPDDTPLPEPTPEPEPIKPIANPVEGKPTTDTAQPATSSPAPVKPIVKKPVTTTMDGLDSMPLFPGCESLDNNKDRKKCFNDKMQRFVQRKFDTGLANRLSINEDEIIKIDILFTINDKGLPVDIKVKAPHEILEKEAYRLIGKLPEITPGKVKGEAVSVYFHLPIRFKINN